jgi:hypothetical protein
MEALGSRPTYDDRVEEDTREIEARELFPEMSIPPSTIRIRIHRGTTDVVSCDIAGGERGALVAEIARLRRRTFLFGAAVGLLIALLRAKRRSPTHVTASSCA